MEILNDFIETEVKDARTSKQIPWLKPMVKMIPNQIIPFITPDCENKVHDPKVLSSPIGKLFCEPGSEMEIDITDEYQNTTPQHLNKNPVFLRTTILTSIAKQFSRGSLPKLNEINNAFNFSTTSAFFTNTTANNNQILNTNLKMFNFRLTNFESKHKFLEPFICSSFLYNDKEKVIISDYWNFIPPLTAKFFDENNISYNNCLTASFQIDPKCIDPDTYFILLISHPIGIDNSSSIIKYYQNPIQVAEASAKKKFSQTFPRLKDIFSTFAVTFIKFSDLRNSFNQPVTLQEPFLTEAPLPEDKIHDFLVDASKKNLKQIRFSISLQRIHDCYYIIRPISQFRAQPLLAPIHQLSVRINSIKLSSSKIKNVAISVSLRCNDKVIRSIHPKLDTTNQGDIDFTRCFYHNKSPPFDDSFLFDLPFPVQPQVELYFEIFHVHVKPGEDDMTLYGTSRLSLFEPDSSLLLKDNRALQVPIDEVNSTDKGKDKLIISTFLRSNLATNDQSFYDFLQNGNKKEELTKKIEALPPNVATTQMMIILDTILNTMIKSSDNFLFTPFLKLRDHCIPPFEPRKFERFLMVFVRYFAFRSFQPRKVVYKEQRIQLNEQHKRRSNSEGIQIVRQSSSLSNLKQNENTSLLDDLNIQTNQTSLDDGDIGDSLIDFNFTKPNSTNTSNDATTMHVDNSQMDVFLPRLFKSYTLMLKTEKSLESMNLLIDFFFALIIKALSVTRITILGPEFEEFITAFCETIPTDKQSASKHAQSLGLFANMLFDIGMPVMSSKVSEIIIGKYLDKAQQHWIIIAYATYAFRPAMFFYSMKYIDSFRTIIINMFQMAIKTIFNDTLFKLFAILLRIIQCYDSEMTTQLASIFVECLHGIRPNQLPTSTEFMTYLSFFNYVLGFADGASLKKFVSADDWPTLFKLVHFLISKTTLKEMTIIKQLQINHLISKEAPEKQTETLEMTGRRRGETVKIGRKKTNALPPLPTRSDSVYTKEKRKQSEAVKNDQIPVVETEQDNERMEFQSNGTLPVRPIQFATPNTKVRPNSSGNPLSSTTAEMINLTHASLIHFAETYLTVADLPVATALVGFVYHMITSEIDQQFYQPLFEIMSDVIKKFAPAIFEINAPCWVRIFECIFKLAPRFQNLELLISPAIALLEADLQQNKCQYVSMAILIRAISFLKKDQLVNENVEKIFESIKSTNSSSQIKLFEIFESLRNVARTLLNKSSSSEERCDALLKRFLSLQGSPDAQFKTLTKLYKHHSTSNDYEEMINVSILQAALIIEYLVITQKEPNFFNNEHPAMLFAQSCPFVDQVCAPQFQLPKVPGFADSEFFSELGFLSILNNVFQLCQKGQIFETAATIIDLVWPILESSRQYGKIESFFEMASEMFTHEFKAPPHSSDAMSYRFYRVTFFGSMFGNNDRKSYIYRQNRLVGLFNYTDYIQKKYSQMTNKEIKIISDSAKVDESTLDKEIGYVQVTYVKPLIKKIKDNSEKLNTTIGLSQLNNQFFYESPFVQGSNEKQGPIDKQWLRRTVLTTEYPLPNITKRALITSEEIKDFEPIRVVYRQLRDRTSDLLNAYEVSDYAKIQQLLSGSLVVTVNEGPEKIAEVFFNQQCDQKRKEKLKIEFKKFVVVLEKAVLLHGEFVTKNPEFMQLQFQLEEGLDRLKDVLLPFIQPK